VRKHFNSEFGINLPEDLCLCIENSPTRWEVVPSAGDTWEFLPEIENDLIAEVSNTHLFFRSWHLILFYPRRVTVLVFLGRNARPPSEDSTLECHACCRAPFVMCNFETSKPNPLPKIHVTPKMKARQASCVNELAECFHPPDSGMYQLVNRNCSRPIFGFALYL
jgi:hypothetical protein